MSNENEMRWGAGKELLSGEAGPQAVAARVDRDPKWIAGEAKPAFTLSWSAKTFGTLATAAVGLALLGTRSGTALGEAVSYLVWTGPGLGAAATQLAMRRSYGGEFPKAAKALGIGAIEGGLQLGGLGLYAVGLVARLGEALGAKATGLDIFEEHRGSKGIEAFRKKIGEYEARLGKLRGGVALENPQAYTEVGAWRAARLCLAEGRVEEAAKIWSASPFNPDWQAGYKDERGDEQSKGFGQALLGALIAQAEKDSMARFPNAKAALKDMLGIEVEWSAPGVSLAEVRKEAAEGRRDEKEALGESSEAWGESLFKPPARLAIPSGQEAVAAGPFALVADPGESLFAKAASELCALSHGGLAADFGDSKLKRFSLLGRRAASALMLDGPARCEDWMKAFGLAGSRLELLGEHAPKGAVLPVELHRPTTMSRFPEIVDAGKLSRYVSRLEAKTGSYEGRLAVSHPEGAMIASKMHAVGNMAGPAFMGSKYGPGTERVILGLANGAAVERLADEVGARLKEDAGLSGGAKVLGKAFVILHEIFHLQQDWEAQALKRAGKSEALAWLPEELRVSERMEHAVEQKADMRAPVHAGKWAVGVLSESYADILASCAMAGFEASASAKSCLAQGVWRAKTGTAEAERKLKSGAIMRVAGLFGKNLAKVGADGHMTSVSLSVAAEVLAGRSGALPKGQELVDFAKRASAAGLLRQIQMVLERPGDYAEVMASEAARAAKLMLGKSLKSAPKNARSPEYEAWLVHAREKSKAAAEALMAKMAEDLDKICPARVSAAPK